MTTNQALAKSRDIREELGITRDVLSNWRRGRTELRPVFLDKISEILGVDLSANVGKR